MDTATEADARRVAREEIASLCGLVLRRMQDDSPEALADDVGPGSRLECAFAEALDDFGKSPTKPGD